VQNQLVTPIQYTKKGQNFQKFQKFKIFKHLKKIKKKFQKISRILCNKTITTIELDQYEVLWSRVHVVLCSIKPHIELVQVQLIV
jgi:hypothetical protein